MSVREQGWGRAGPALLLALALAGCGGVGSAGLPTFDLTAPTEFGEVRQARGLLSIAVPTALQPLDSERIVILPTPSEVNYMADARWSDRLPRLVQARIVQAFENGKRIRAVARAGDKLNSDYQLATDVREFGLRIESAPAAVVEISARLINERTGRVVASRVFSARQESSSPTGAAATAAIDSAFQSVLVEMVQWTSARI